MKTMIPQKSGISVVIPTYGRDEVLIQTISHLIALEPQPYEILIVDQTIRHPASVQAALEEWNALGTIRYLRLAEPSITKAMNLGLKEAKADVVLFLDDDIIPDPGLLAAHGRGHGIHKVAAIAGRVIQPWHEGKDLTTVKGFHFASADPAWIDQFMGGNVSVKRETALDLGGFDENFVRVAYNFEVEFGHRLVSSGHRIRYEPTACIHHLKVDAGGTRSYGRHLTTISPDHAVGAYYCALRTKRGWRRFAATVGRPLRAVMTRHHLWHPWWIPVSLVAEVRGLVWAFRLWANGPRYMTHSPEGSES